MDACRSTKAKKLLFLPSVVPAVVLSLQSVFPMLDISGRQGHRYQSSLHRKLIGLISAATSVVVLGLFMYCCNLRWQLMNLLYCKIFWCLFPVCRRLMERCLGCLLKCLFFSPFPRGRCVYFLFNLLIRLQNEDSIKTLAISRPSFALLRGDINSLSCVVGIL